MIRRLGNWFQRLLFSQQNPVNNLDQFDSYNSYDFDNDDWGHYYDSYTLPREPAYGGVVVNADGKVLLVEPAEHFDGVVWTFPKGKQDKGESPEQTALREVREESGISATIISTLPGEYEGSTSITKFFLMKCDLSIADGVWDKETAGIRWVDFNEALGLISKTLKSSAKIRDLAVLNSAKGYMVSSRPEITPPKEVANPQSANDGQQDLIEPKEAV